MRASVVALGATLHLALYVLLLSGWGDMNVRPGVALLGAAPVPSGGQQSPEEWIRRFDLRRERLLDRLDGRLEELRRRLEKHGSPRRMLSSCG